MRSCEHIPEQIHIWFDGEVCTWNAEQNSLDIMQEHINSCPVCQSEVRRLRLVRQQLYLALDGVIGELEPLLALQKVRCRIATRSRRGMWVRLSERLADLARFNRWVLACLGGALALSGLVALWMLGFVWRQ